MMYYSLISSMNKVVLPNPLWDNLVYCFTGDNNTTDLIGSRNGTLVNGATYATGKINNGFSFDGVNDYMSTPSTAPFNHGLAHSYSCWVKLNATTIGIFISTATSLVGIRGGGNLSFFRYYVDGEANSGTILAINTWYHIVVVYKGTTPSTNNVLFYVNGSLVNTNSLTLPNNSGAQLTLGSAGGSAGFFNGIVDEPYVWNKALTSTQVTELYNSGSGKQYPL